MWRKTYPYLNNEDFLKLIDTQHLQNQYVKITLLDWEENPLEEIQGHATEGSININGNSSVRRTCSLNMSITDLADAAITQIDNLFSIGKKIFLEIGIDNSTGLYEDEYPIVWYPQGYFVFTQCTLTHDLNNGISLSAQLKDKMCLLNGDCGGIIPSTVQFDQWDTIDENGKWITEKVTIAQIIREAVNHWGKEQLGKILISDIDENIKMVMRWLGNNPIYLIHSGANYYLTMDSSQDNKEQTFYYGDDIGFIYTKFIYNKELIAKPGDNICTAVLEPIKNFLGNYEYFYDVYGNFVFQEIKDYQNTTYTTHLINELQKEDYEIDISKGKSVYDFADNQLAISFSNTPQYNRIKNDFVIWGVRENTDKIKLPIRYHLAIDKKPKVGNIFNIYSYINKEDSLLNVKIPLEYNNKSSFPIPGNVDSCYLDKSTDILYIWDSTQGENGEYMLPSGYPTLEYDSYAFFPSNPIENVVYIDKSTKIGYIWNTKPSPHYNEIQEDIDELIQDYQNDMNNLKSELIDFQELLIADTQSLEDYLKIYAETVAQYNLYNQDLINITSTINKIDVLIAQNIIEINNLTNEITELNIEKTELEEEAEQETDPDKKSQLLENINKIVLAIEEKTNIKNTDTVENTALNQQKTDLSTTRIYDTSLVDTLEAQLNSSGYFNLLTAITTDENNIKQNKINQNTITNTYIQNLAELKYQQKEYVAFSDIYVQKVKTTDWRTELLLEGAAAESLGLEKNYYYEELKTEWLKLYDLAVQKYIYFGNKSYTQSQINNHTIGNTYIWPNSLFIATQIGDLLFLNVTCLDNNEKYLYILQCNADRKNTEQARAKLLSKERVTSFIETNYYTGDFKEGVIEYPWDLNYWLDFIDTDSAIGELNISNIGRRTLSESKDDYNCLFEPEVQDFVLIETGQPDTAEKILECQKRSQRYIQVSSIIFNNLSIGGFKNSCFERVKNALYDYTSYLNAISISSVPIYHLEVNNRINIINEEDNIYGDHLINSISFPLTIDGTMNITATKCNAKL